MTSIYFNYSIGKDNIENANLIRQICANNNLWADLVIHTDKTFIPHILVELGLFSSSSQVKKNRNDLWRELIDGEEIQIGDLFLTIYKHCFINFQDVELCETYGSGQFITELRLPTYSYKARKVTSRRSRPSS